MYRVILERSGFAGTMSLCFHHARQTGVTLARTGRSERLFFPRASRTELNSPSRTDFLAAKDLFEQAEAVTDGHTIGYVNGGRDIFN
jgi:hypothetical protein